MSGNYIRLTEVLDHMERLDGNMRPVPFLIKFVTANRKKRTGGEVIEIDKAIKVIGKGKDGKEIIDLRPNELPSKSKDPRHWINATRNLLLPNGQIRKIHIRLIIEFNGRKVCY
jgi:hypothetical protein